MLGVLAFGLGVALVFHLCVTPVIFWLRRKWVRNPNEVELNGPPFLAWIGRYFLNLARYGSNVNATNKELILNYFDRYGSVYSVEFFGRRMIFVADPDVAKHVLASTKYSKVSDESGVIRTMAPKSLLLVEDAEWEAQRHKLARLFAAPMVKLMQPIMITKTQQLIENWKNQLFHSPSSSQSPPSITVDLHQAMTRLAFAIIAKCTLNLDEVEDMSRYFHEILEVSQAPWRRFVPLSHHLPIPPNITLEHALRKLRELVDMALLRHKAQKAGLRLPNSTKPLPADAPFQSLLDYISFDDFSPEQIRDNMVSFLLAGHETSASFLSFAIYILAITPTLQTTVVGELAQSASVIGPSSTLSQVLREALRIYPPAPMIGRVALREDRLPTGATVRTNDMVLISVYGMHHREDNWKHSEEVDPRRYQGRSEEEMENKSSAWIPFSNGLRMCPGASFAMVEGQVILGRLLREFVLSLDPAYHFGIQQLATLRPKNGLPIVLTPRTR